MSRGYWVVKANVHDIDEYSKYIDLATIVVKNYNGNFLVRGGDQQEKEEKGFSRTVVVEFDSYEIAQSCYQSKDYQTALDHVRKSSIRSFTIVKGI